MNLSIYRAQRDSKSQILGYKKGPLLYQAQTHQSLQLRTFTRERATNYRIIILVAVNLKIFPNSTTLCVLKSCCNFIGGGGRRRCCPHLHPQRGVRALTPAPISSLTTSVELSKYFLYSLPAEYLRFLDEFVDRRSQVVNLSDCLLITASLRFTGELVVTFGFAFWFCLMWGERYRGRRDEGRKGERQTDRDQRETHLLSS